jgi:NADH dehydrogenase FAD-containing subunit
VEILLGEVVGFELDKRAVLLKDGSRLEYEYLVVAAGAQHSYFGHDDDCRSERLQLAATS